MEGLGCDAQITPDADPVEYNRISEVFGHSSYSVPLYGNLMEVEVRLNLGPCATLDGNRQYVLGAYHFNTVGEGTLFKMKFQ